MSLDLSERRLARGTLRRPITRRRAAAIIGAGLALPLLGGCGDNGAWHADDVSGTSPALALTMTRASDGKTVTAADYRGKIVMLYFGYTFCPDVCPTTLSNLAEVFDRLGPAARNVRVLFVTVDPNRDTPAVLADYVKNFGSQFEGLRGTPDQLASLARRYRVAYSVKPKTKNHPYEVSHSSAIYVFDESGKARLLVTSMATTTPDINGTESDLRRIFEETNPPSFLDRLRRWL